MTAAITRCRAEQRGAIRLDLEMGDPVRSLFEELTWPDITQASVAITYAYIVAQTGDAADWPRINAAIRAKWSGVSSLERVKQMAWKHLDRWRGAAR